MYVSVSSVVMCRVYFKPNKRNSGFTLYSLGKFSFPLYIYIVMYFSGNGCSNVFFGFFFC